MKISISAQTFDLDNYILLENVQEIGSEYENYSRRVTRTATLDSGVVIQDNGFNHGDRTLTFQAEITQLEWETLRNLVKNFSVLTLTTPEGAYQGSLSVENNYGIATITFMIESSLSDWTPPTTTTTSTTSTTSETSSCSSSCSTTSGTTLCSTTSSHTTSCSSITTETTTCSTSTQTSSCSTVSSQSTESTVSSVSTSSTSQTSSCSTVSSQSTTTSSTTRITTSCSSSCSTVSSESTQTSSCSTVSSESTLSTVSSTCSSSCSTVSSESTISSTSTNTQSTTCSSTESTLSTQSSSCSTVSTQSSTSTSTVTCDYNEYFSSQHWWNQVYVAGGASASIVSNTIKINLPDSTDCGIIMLYRWGFGTENFDLRIDVTEHSPEDAQYGGQFSIAVRSENTEVDYAGIRLMYDGGQDKLRTRWRVNSVQTDEAQVNATPTALRIVKKGSNLSTYYSTGSGWTHMYTKDFSGREDNLDEIILEGYDAPWNGGPWGGFVRWDNLIFWSGCPDTEMWTSTTSTTSNTTTSTTPPP